MKICETEVREYSEKTKNYTKEKWAEISEGVMTIFAEFASAAIEAYCRGRCRS